MGGNERARLADLASLSLEDWLKKGMAGANATACSAASIGAYTLNVTAACKQVTAGGGTYSLEFTARYGCTVTSTSAAKKANAPRAAGADADATVAAPAAAPSSSGPAPGDKASVKVTLRAVVGQPPLREAADGGRK